MLLSGGSSSSGPAVAPPPKEVTMEEARRWGGIIHAFVMRNNLVMLFALAVIISLSFPQPGGFMASIEVGPERLRLIEFINNVVVFFTSGLALNLSEVQISLYIWPLVYGLITINFITTLVAFVMIRLPFPTAAFSEGLAIFSTVPTTLGLGVALTLQAKGDHLLGLLLTVSSNILGIVFVPLLLSIYLAGADLKISPDDLIIRLVYTVFIPSICGIAARRYSSTVSDLVVRHKVAIGLFSNVNLICIVWMALSKSRSVIVQQSAGEIVCLIVATVLQHCFYLAYNYILLRQIGIFPLKQMIAVLIMASQKSSPVALAVVTNIASDDNDRGLLTIPCVIGQLAQIFIGSFIANRFALIVDEQGRKEAKAEAVRPFVDAEASNTIELSPLNNMR